MTMDNSSVLQAFLKEATNCKVSPSLERVAGKVVDALEIFREATKEFPGLPWEIGFSGGKDSSVVCHLAFEHIRQSLIDGSTLPKKVYILYSDTLLDFPVLRMHTLSTLRSMEQYANRFNSLVEIKVLKPAEGEDFLV